MMRFTQPTQNKPNPGAAPTTDPFRNNVVLHLHFDGADGSTSIVDSSPTAKAITVSGNARISTAQSVFGGSSGYFDGQDSPGSYLGVADSDDWHFPGSYTIEFRIRPTVIKTVPSWLFLQSATSGGVNPILLQLTTSGQISVSGSTDNTNWLFTSLTSTTALAAGTWYHVAATDDGTTFRLFINGNLEASRASWSKTDSAQPLLIAGGWNGGDREFNGHLDELIVTKGVPRYTRAFTPPAWATPSA